MSGLVGPDGVYHISVCCVFVEPPVILRNFWRRLLSPFRKTAILEIRNQIRAGYSR